MGAVHSRFIGYQLLSGCWLLLALGSIHHWWLLDVHADSFENMDPGQFHELLAVHLKSTYQFQWITLVFWLVFLLGAFALLYRLKCDWINGLFLGFISGFVFLLILLLRLDHTVREWLLEFLGHNNFSLLLVISIEVLLAALFYNGSLSGCPKNKEQSDQILDADLIS